MNDQWLRYKLEEQQEQYAQEIVALRNTLLDIQKDFNHIEELKKYFVNDDKFSGILKTWEPHLKAIFTISNKYKG